MIFCLCLFIKKVPNKCKLVSIFNNNIFQLIKKLGIATPNIEKTCEEKRCEIYAKIGLDHYDIVKLFYSRSGR